MTRLRGKRGSTLVEAIIAIGILTGAVVTLAGLASLATRMAMLARERSVATLLANQKVEAITQSVSLVAVSPAEAWAVDTPGYVEYLDAYGRLVSSRGGGVYVRRWAVTPLPSDGNLVAIQVEVAPCRAGLGDTRCGDSTARVRLASIRSRVAW